MNPRVAVSLTDSVVFKQEGPNEMTLSGSGSHPSWNPRVKFSQLTPALLSALDALSQGGRTSAEIGGEVMKLDSFPGLAKFRYCLKAMEDSGFVKYSLVLGDLCLLVVRPVAAAFGLRTQEVDPKAPYVLSRFAYFRRDGSHGFVIAAPTAHAVAQLCHPASFSALYRFSTPTCAEELQDTTPEFDLETAQAFMSCLINVGAIVEVNQDGATHEDTDPALGQWSFHDLAFHTNARLGRNSGSYGGTGSNAERFAAPPMVKPPPSDETVQLYRPDIAELTRKDPSFTHVLEHRRSVRTYGEAPLHVDQLGEFLFRSARVKKVIESAGLTWRPSPAGGAIHELEIYPVVDQCDGLPAGVYHYSPFDHTLSRVKTDRAKETRRILQLAAVMGLLEREAPPILLVLSARFQRMQIKYDSVAYSLILRHVGALTQTMYLVAEAMGLAGCAVGGGDSDLLARIIESDYYSETSVGEFLLGTGPSVRPEPLSPPKGVTTGRVAGPTPSTD